ncbi:hypothetical protein IIC38_19240 [candidate division KSB1 bacterium]|nr:hypothetical protein [candidate division KSB1 bacterium]
MTSKKLQDDFLLDVLDAEGRFIYQMITNIRTPFQGRGRIFESGSRWKKDKVYTIEPNEEGTIRSKTVSG